MLICRTIYHACTLQHLYISRIWVRFCSWNHWLPSEVVTSETIFRIRCLIGCWCFSYSIETSLSGILDDTFALCEACSTPFSSLLNLMDTYRKDIDILCCQDLLMKLGWDVTPGESHLNALIREEVLTGLASFDHPPTKVEAIKRFQADRNTSLLPVDTRKVPHQDAGSLRSCSTFLFLSCLKMLPHKIQTGIWSWRNGETGWFLLISCVILSPHSAAMRLLMKSKHFSVPIAIAVLFPPLCRFWSKVWSLSESKQGGLNT